MAGVTNTTPSHLLERAAPPLAAHPPARPPVASVRGAFREQLLAVKGVETAPLRGRDAANVRPPKSATDGRFSLDLGGLVGRPVDGSSLPATERRLAGGATEGLGRDPERREPPSLDDASNPAVNGAEASPAWCDSLARSLLHIAPPPQLAASTPASPIAPSVLDQIASQLVRRAGVGASSVHLQFGAGKLDGGELLVQVGPEGLEVRITPPVGTDGSALAVAIEARLARRGLRVSQITVD